MGSVEREHGGERRIDTPPLLRREMTDQVTEAPDIDGTDLLHQHPRHDAVHLDLGSEGGGTCPCRGRCDEHDGSRQQCIGLDDDPEAFAMLLASHTPRHSKGEDVTPTHAGSP